MMKGYGLWDVEAPSRVDDFVCHFDFLFLNRLPHQTLDRVDIHLPC